jgi:hypothetical protein
MIKIKLIIISFLLASNGCSDKKSFNRKIIGVNEKYFEYKKQYDSNLINHFPANLISIENFIISNTNTEKNDVGLFLFEYNLQDSEIKKLENRTIKSSLNIYSTKDLCLLKVNPFETIETKEKFVPTNINDSTLINKPCYKNLLPIPNFIDFSIATKTKFWNDENFDIYVLEAKSGNHFKKFELMPNPQMPKEWENGYSKGIAINKEKKTVIYWSIIW